MSIKLVQVENIEANELLNHFGELKNEVSEIKKHLQNVAPLELLERSDVAELLNVTFTTLHDWVKKGVLPAHKIGNRVYFKRSEIESALVTIKHRKNGN